MENMKTSKLLIDRYLKLYEYYKRVHQMIMVIEMQTVKTISFKQKFIAIRQSDGRAGFNYFFW